MSEKKLEPEQKAYVALRTAYLEYTRWQPDGDWDTFLSYASDERGPIRSDLIEEYTRRNFPSFATRPSTGVVTAMAGGNSSGRFGGNEPE